MIEPPPTSAPPALGPLPAPSEDEAAGAYAELRNEALTLAWAAEALGTQAAQLLMLARAGELLLVPGPWPMRQASSPGYFVPAWQLLPGSRRPHRELPTLLAAAAEAGWTSLELHRFMITPLGQGGLTPAALLRSTGAAQVAALIRGESPAATAPQPPKTSQRRHPLRALHRAGGRRNLPQAAGSVRPLPGGAPPPAGRRLGEARPATAYRRE